MMKLPKAVLCLSKIVIRKQFTTNNSAWMLPEVSFSATGVCGLTCEAGGGGGQRSGNWFFGKPAEK